ncbi:MAG: hypothetical protein L6V93_15975 [Clostridiales bacterium]|nr:MAG: hypothetical protein L6V93_15975 [Clostridiales bacterium]
MEFKHISVLFKRVGRRAEHQKKTAFMPTARSAAAGTARKFSNACQTADF